jgi:hypothetical protein
LTIFFLVGIAVGLKLGIRILITWFGIGTEKRLTNPLNNRIFTIELFLGLGGMTDDEQE